MKIKEGENEGEEKKRVSTWPLSKDSEIKLKKRKIETERVGVWG